MKDATMRQGKGLFELLLQAEDPYVFTQNLIERWGAVQLIGEGKFTQAKLIEALKHIDRTTNPYVKEETAPAFLYPQGYQHASPEAHIKTLRGWDKTWDSSYVREYAATWEGYEQADGLAVVPDPIVLAAKLGIEDPWDNFGALIERGPFAALRSQRKFTNYRERQLVPERYRLAESAKAEFIRLREEQPKGDFLVFPIQSGKLYAGQSPRNSRWRIDHATSPTQWPSTAYVVGWELYSNPERLSQNNHLLINCPGDEVCLTDSEEFGGVLCFNVYGGRLYCRADWCGRIYNYWGAASGFGR